MRQAQSHTEVVIESLEPRRLLAATSPFGNGVGIIGDSIADEYQFYPPDRSTAQSFSELLAKYRDFNLGTFSTTSWGAPRNQGYEYNWAESGDTTSDAVSEGQATGLAAQEHAGKIGTVLIFIGGNDFINALFDDYTGSQLTDVLPTALQNLGTLLNTALSANGHVHVVVATMAPVVYDPVVQQYVGSAFSSDELTAVNDMELQFNADVRSLATGRGSSRVAIADFGLLAQKIHGHGLTIDGVTMNSTTGADSPDNLILADGLHPNTALQAELSNLFISAIDTKWNAGVSLFSESQIAGMAGI